MWNLHHFHSYTADLTYLENHVQIRALLNDLSQV